MKQFLRFISLIPLWLIPLALNAQICTPDPFLGPGLSPASFDTACVGEFFDEPMTFLALDTFGVSPALDSTVITGVLDLPAGLSWECDRQAFNCVYLQISQDTLFKGCFNVFGTPTQTTGPGHTIRLATATYFYVSGFPVEILDTMDIPLQVVSGGNCQTSIQPKSSRIREVTLAPHPLDPTSTLSFYLFRQDEVSIQFWSTSGRKASSLFHGPLAAGDHVFNLDPVPPGLHVLEIRTGADRFVTRILKVGIATK